MRVVVVQKWVPHYRAPFFDLLRARLARDSIALDLVYGHSRGGAKSGEVDPPWGTRISNRGIRAAGVELLWQPVLSSCLDADLVIVEQAARLLSNYALQFAYWVRHKPRFAFWGHGRNFQSRNSRSWPELLKRAVSKRVHWWFAYTELSARVVSANGFPRNRITVVQNAIDTAALVVARAELSSQAIAGLRQSLALTSENVCVFAGSMYRERRVPFLIEACRQIRSQVPDFHMLFLGTGPEATLVEAAAREHQWIHYLGARFGMEKVAAFALAKLQLMPGVVGLGVLDSFALETPMVTTSRPGHGPEIEYLTPERGVIVADTDDPARYANEVTALLGDVRRLSAMRRACAEASHIYTMDTMVDNFARGVHAALA